MSDIFISYASEDKSRVQALARALEQKGWSVWWDRRIPAGKSFDEVIHEALKSARSVVVVWTKTSVKSTWVKNESRSGMRRGVLFPVMLLDEVEIPLEFEHLQAAHLMDWEPDREHPSFEQFLDDLIGVIGAPVTSVVHSHPVPHLLQEPPTSLMSESASQSKAADDREPVRAVLGLNNNLLALTVSQGSLSPVFSANILNYTVNVGSNVANVTISATKADPNAVLSGDVTVGSGIATGQATLPLNGPGTVTPAVLTVTASNGSSKTYRITVNRAAPSGNNNLSTLSVLPGTLSPPFSVNALNYTVNVCSNVTNVTVSATKSDPNAVISGDVSVGAGIAIGQAIIQLGGPGTTTGVTIWVTAPGGAQKTYTLNVSRAALRGNNDLQSLSVSPGTLSPSFRAKGTAYTVNVGDNVTSVAVTPTLQDDNSSITINGQGTHAGQARFITLAPAGSSTEIEIRVIAQNGSDKTYLIAVSRAALSRAAEVEPEPERLEQNLSGAVTDAAGPDSSMESASSTEVTDVSGGDQESARVSGDRSSESTGTGQSTDSFPYLPIGLGALVAIGALVYFLIFRKVLRLGQEASHNISLLCSRRALGAR